MLNLASETDIGRRRRAALLREREKARLPRRRERLVAALAESRDPLGEAARRAIRTAGVITPARDFPDEYSESLTCRPSVPVGGRTANT